MQFLLSPKKRNMCVYNTISNLNKVVALVENTYKETTSFFKGDRPMTTKERIMAIKLYERINDSKDLLKQLGVQVKLKTKNICRNDRKENKK